MTKSKKILNSFFPCHLHKVKKYHDLGEICNRGSVKSVEKDCEGLEISKKGPNLK